MLPENNVLGIRRTEPIPASKNDPVATAFISCTYVPHTLGTNSFGRQARVLQGYLGEGARGRGASVRRAGIADFAGERLQGERVLPIDPRYATCKYS